MILIFLEKSLLLVIQSIHSAPSPPSLHRGGSGGPRVEGLALHFLSAFREGEARSQLEVLGSRKVKERKWLRLALAFGFG